MLDVGRRKRVVPSTPGYIMIRKQRSGRQRLRFKVRRGPSDITTKKKTPPRIMPGRRSNTSRRSRRSHLYKHTVAMISAVFPLIRKESNATGFAGVTPNKKRFSAKICIAGKEKSLGTFDTVEEAALIYARVNYYLDQNELRSTPFIDLTGVPPQPLILKNQMSFTCYKDNSRRRPTKDGSSKYTGIYYNKESKKWKAQIMVQGKVRSIGYFDKEEDAAADYARAAFKYKPTKQSLQTYGGLDLSNVPETLPLIRSERSSTGYKGVKLTHRGRYEARIGMERGKEPKTLGVFDTAEEAALIYSRAKYYLDHKGKQSQGDNEGMMLVSEPPAEDGAIEANAVGAVGEKIPTNEDAEDDDDPVDSCFIDSAGDKVDGVAV